MWSREHRRLFKKLWGNNSRAAIHFIFVCRTVEQEAKKSAREAAAAATRAAKREAAVRQSEEATEVDEEGG